MRLTGLAIWTNMGEESMGTKVIASEGQTKGPAKLQTLFAIASNSKLFAAVSIGLLINNDTRLENGDKLEYSTKIKDILPNWTMVDSYMTDHLDVLDLLCMSYTPFKVDLYAHSNSYAKRYACSRWLIRVSPTLRLS